MTPDQAGSSAGLPDTGGGDRVVPVRTRMLVM